MLFVHSLNRHLEGPEELFACHRTSEVKETRKAATKELSKYRDDPKPYRTACLIIEPNILAYAIVSCGLMDEGAKPQKETINLQVPEYGCRKGFSRTVEQQNN